MVNALTRDKQGCYWKPGSQRRVQRTPQPREWDRQRFCVARKHAKPERFERPSAPLARGREKRSRRGSLALSLAVPAGSS